MNILMMTNTYLPHVGGVAQSVEAFAKEIRARGHQVLIVAPEFPDMPEEEEHVVRLPAIQEFNGTDFSVRLPIPGVLDTVVDEFLPDVVHAHHPFMLGDAAQRVAAKLKIPLVFTHHTMYERYTHYVPGDSSTMQRFVIDLATHYANLADCVIAPSESIAEVLRERGVQTPIEPIPTGVDVERFANGDRQRARREFNIPSTAYVVGHLGRLAPEKNLPFLARAVSTFLRRHPDAHFLVVGSGPSETEIQEICRSERVHKRVHLVGVRRGQELVDAYHAMDVFAFASTSETQGMVLTEAMAAGVPVVGVDAPGVREVIVDQVNGRLLSDQDSDSFAEALDWVADQKADALKNAALKTADSFAMGRCAERALNVYQTVLDAQQAETHEIAARDSSPWESTIRLIDAEYQLWSNRTAAMTTAISEKYLSTNRLIRWMKRSFQRLRRQIPTRPQDARS